MPRSGTGQFLPANSSWNPAIGGVLATAGDWQALLNDLSAALTQSVSRDGQSPMQGNLPLGNNKIVGLAPGTGTGEALAFQQLFSQGTMADIASTATMDIGIQNTSFLRVTGTTTITSFGTNYRGPRFLTFEGAVTLSNSSVLVLPGNANITTAAGDSLIVIPGATLGVADRWVVVAYQSAAGTTQAQIDARTGTAGGLGFRNRLINAQGLINQRAYVSGTATTSANQYTLDRWRVVVSGQNLTFTTTANETTFTAPAGGIEQVIEGLNLESGTYVLNWEGTATATVGGTAVAKGGTVTVVGGTNTTVRFIGGTFIRPQFEAGTVATPFERRPYGTEYALCERYYQILSAAAYRTYVANTVRDPRRMSTAMRATPTLIKTVTGAINLGADNTVGTSAATWLIDLQFTGGGTGVIDISSYTVVASAEL